MDMENNSERKTTVEQERYALRIAISGIAAAERSVQEAALKVKNPNSVSRLLTFKSILTVIRADIAAIEELEVEQA